MLCDSVQLTDCLLAAFCESSRSTTCPSLISPYNRDRKWFQERSGSKLMLSHACLSILVPFGESHMGLYAGYIGSALCGEEVFLRGFCEFCRE